VATAREAVVAGSTSQARDAEGTGTLFPERGKIPGDETLVEVCVQEGSLQGRGRGRAGSSHTGTRKAKLAPRRSQFKKGRAE
jgi:hypothetical protein